MSLNILFNISLILCKIQSPYCGSAHHAQKQRYPVPPECVVLFCGHSFIDWSILFNTLLYIISCERFSRLTWEQHVREQRYPFLQVYVVFECLYVCDTSGIVYFLFSRSSSGKLPLHFLDFQLPRDILPCAVRS